MFSSASAPQLRAALLAALIAVMIWAYAEGESVSSRSLVVAVSFPRQPVGDVVIKPDPSFTGVVRVRLEGTTRTIDAAANVLLRDIRLTPGSPGVPDTPGKSTVDLRAALGSIPDLAEFKGSLAEVEPKVVPIEVVRLVSRELPVRAQLEGDAALYMEPSCVPSSVTIRVPAEDAHRIPDGASAVAFVSEPALRRVHLSSIRGGEDVQSVVGIVRAPAEAEGIDPVLITPEQVMVGLRLKRKVESLKLPSVPMWVGLPASEESGKWSVEVQDKAITDVLVLGPAEDIESIRSGKTKIRAMIELTHEDLEKGITSKQATFTSLPPGVTASADSQIVRIQRISRREAPPPAKP
jgi:hypothetical protein